MEGYLTVRSGVEATGELTDRKSRFIAQLVHVESEEEAQAHQARVRARHFDARHHVPAWILASGAERASDDGEPQRTGGVPTLDVLRGAGLRDVCCVTTRYFGGTLLGPGGLVRAYAGAAQEAVAAARAAGGLVEMCLVTPVTLHVPYALFEQVRRLVEACGGSVSSSDFTADIAITAVFRAGEEGLFVERLRELTAGQVEAAVGSPRFDAF